jgi:hypothetical protein
MKYAYACPIHGVIEADAPADSFICMTDGCRQQAKRLRAFNVDKVSLKTQARWDPIVGAYVRNDSEFRSLLSAGQERESNELGMDVVLTQVDSRDKEALAELHGHSVNERDSVAEQTQRAHHDEAMA